MGFPQEHVEVAFKYAKSFLPIFFRLYTEVPVKSENGPIVNDSEIKLSAFETVRTYLPFISKELINIHVNLALKKMQDESISDERKVIYIFQFCYFIHLFNLK